ncbi:MAG TPA: hypothetical protein VMO47_11380 [Rhodothermales bacterium]|nr:hypothetical protein [Rhodothermales bacterium]
MGTSQVIYALAALVIAGILSFQFLLGSRATNSRVYSNEILTQVSGVATEIIENIGSRAFDHFTREDLYPPPDSAGQLTDPGDFGWGGSPEACDTLCMDIDDFHNVTFQKEHDGIDFEVTVTVRYVDPDNPETVVAGKSFAKEVLLGITNPNIYREGNPDSLITMEVGRVFTYFKTTI